MSTAARHLPLLPIVLIALALRLYGLNWDYGFHLHPDERFIAIVSDRIRLPDSVGQYFSTASSPLNPYNNGFDGFAYGTLPLFAGRFLGELTGYDGYDRIVLLGRALSALADLGTVVFVYLLGSLIYGRMAGLFGTAVLALAVLPIQLAHFYAFDTFLTFFTAWSLYFAYRVWLAPRPVDLFLLGAGVGCSVACKVSALILLPVVALALLTRPTRSATLGSTLWNGALVALSALLVYRLAAPYAFLGTSLVDIRPNPKFVSDMLSWIRISSGESEVPFMIQWAYTPKYSFAIESIVRWGLGPAAGLAAFGGLLLALVRLTRWGAETRHLLLVAWVLLNLVYFGGQFAKFMRYLLPVYPALAVLAGFFLATLWGRWAAPRLNGAGHRRLVGLAGRAAAAAVLLLTALWALAFVQIYSQPNTRVTASEWIYDNLPAGATLALEHWDDGLPLQLANRPSMHFREVSMNLYDDENQEKLRKLIESLQQADYIVLASNRLYGSIPRLPQRYPLATEYYRALFDGRLGFEPLAEFTSRPRLLGLEIVDDGAQEDFTVYDHPKIQIYRKGASYDLARVASLLGSVALDDVQRVKPVEAGLGSQPVLSPAEWATAQRGGTWSSLFELDGPANQFPILVWWLAATILGLAIWPLLFWLSPALADRGFGIARLLGLLTVAYLSWLLASLKLAPFGRGSLLGALVIVGGLSLLAARPWLPLRGYLGRAWPALLASEVAFNVGFALCLALRLVNPDLWHGSFGGEKPMDFAYLNAVVKSDYFPPYDPWFAGGSINYYYFGFVLVAALVKVTGVAPAVAYNLALALWFGFLSQAAFSLAYNLAVGRSPARGGRGRLALVSGALAVLFVGLVGNLDGAAQVRDALWRAAGPRFDSGIPVLAGLARALLGLGALLRREVRLDSFDFWRSTRLIGPEEPGPITEFPFFTFLYGDLHAHLLALPLTLAAGLLSLALARERTARAVLAGWSSLPGLARAAGLRLAGLVGLLGLVVGALRATNTWDYPTYLAAGVLGLACLLRPLRREQVLASLVAIGVSSAALFAVSGLLYGPFLDRYQLFYSGLVRSAAQTAPSQFLTVNGHWLFVLTSVLVLASVRIPAPTSRRATAARPGAAYYGLVLPLPVAWPLDAAWTLAGLGLGLAGLLLWASGLGTLALLLGLAIWLLLVVWRRWRSPQAVFQFGLAGLAVTVLALPDLVTLKGDVGRMNTVFKFYLQAWVLLAVLAAVWAPRLAARRPVWRLVGPSWRRVWLVAAAILLVSLLIYPLRGGPAKLGVRFEPLPFGLDGMAFMATASYRDRERDVGLPADYAAIRWLQEEIEGSPVLLEASIGLYKWGSRVSTYTGLPTVIGWDWHQTQQRVGMARQVDTRVKDVKTIYESSRLEQALPLLRKYGVRYIYVGGLERIYYPNGVSKFEQAPADVLEPVYQDAGVTIYAVKDTV